MALQLASQGANLILWDINSTTLVNIEQEISRMETGSTVQTNVVDVSDEKEVKKSAVITHMHTNTHTTHTHTHTRARARAQTRTQSIQRGNVNGN